VATAADRQLQSGLAGQGDDPGDVVVAGGLDDHLGAAVEAAIEDGPRLVVGGIIGRDHPATHLRA
jgi:hypothetical protein